MKRIVAFALIAVGAALLAFSAREALRAPPAPYERRAAQGGEDALREASAFGVAPELVERIEFVAQELKKPVASAVVMRGKDGRRAPLVWRNDVTEPVFFADSSAADVQKVLAAIRDHVPQDAVVLAWWDMSRLIRAFTGRAAPLDDPLARGLLTPKAWAPLADPDGERAYWGEGAPAGEAPRFGKFIDALLLDEGRGAAALEQLAEGKPAYVVVQLADIWKAAAVRPDSIAIASRDFPAGNGAHGVMKAASQWLQQQQIESGYAVEPIGSATRLHVLPRPADAQVLLARLLPFSTSNALQLNRLQLVYQHKAFWIYKLTDGKS